METISPCTSMTATDSSNSSNNNTPESFHTKREEGGIRNVARIPKKRTTQNPPARTRRTTTDNRHRHRHLHSRRHVQEKEEEGRDDRKQVGNNKNDRYERHGHSVKQKPPASAAADAAATAPIPPRLPPPDLSQFEADLLLKMHHRAHRDGEDAIAGGSSVGVNQITVIPGGVTLPNQRWQHNHHHHHHQALEQGIVVGVPELVDESSFSNEPSSGILMTSSSTSSSAFPPRNQTATIRPTSSASSAFAREDRDAQAKNRGRRRPHLPAQPGVTTASTTASSATVAPGVVHVQGEGDGGRERHDLMGVPECQDEVATTGDSDISTTILRGTTTTTTTTTNASVTAAADRDAQAKRRASCYRGGLMSTTRTTMSSSGLAIMMPGVVQATADQQNYRVVIGIPEQELSNEEPEESEIAMLGGRNSNSSTDMTMRKDQNSLDKTTTTTTTTTTTKLGTQSDARPGAFPASSARHPSSSTGKGGHPCSSGKGFMQQASSSSGGDGTAEAVVGAIAMPSSDGYDQCRPQHEKKTSSSRRRRHHHPHPHPQDPLSFSSSARKRHQEGTVGQADGVTSNKNAEVDRSTTATRSGAVHSTEIPDGPSTHKKRSSRKTKFGGSRSTERRRRQEDGRDVGEGALGASATSSIMMESFSSSFGSGDDDENFWTPPDDSQPHQQDVDDLLTSMRHLEEDILIKHNNRSATNITCTIESPSDRDFAVPPPASWSSSPSSPPSASQHHLDPAENSNRTDGHYYAGDNFEDEPTRPEQQQWEGQSPPPSPVPERHAGVMYGSQDLIDTEQQEAFVEAFVADEKEDLERRLREKGVIDATGVAVLLSAEEEEKLDEAKCRQYKCWGIMGFAFVAIAVLLPMLFLAGGGGGDGGTIPRLGLRGLPTEFPSAAPSFFPTFSPTTERFDEVLMTVASLSEMAALSDKSSPQYRAALWIAEEDVLQLPIGDNIDDNDHDSSGSSSTARRFLQRYILAVFYFALDGDNWIHCSRLDPTCGGDPRMRAWLVDTDSECTWRAIACDGDSGDVTQINFRDMRGNGLRGQLPYEVSQLPELTGMMLYRNHISGTLPWFLGYMTKLSYLFLYDNEMTGTLPGGELLRMTELEKLYLTGNSFNGTIPKELGMMPNLVDVRLNSNKFVGNIPSLPHMGFFSINDNMITGSLSDTFYESTKLAKFYANNNNLTGTLSSKIGNMVSLVNLRLGGNHGLGGTLPSELFTLPKIAQFNITSCNFTGTLSEDLALFNGTMTQLILENNNFSGPLPLALLNSMGNVREVTLHGNDLTGTIASSDGLCQLRGSSIYSLNNLTADCGSSGRRQGADDNNGSGGSEDNGGGKVSCDCCNYCAP